MTSQQGQRQHSPPSQMQSLPAMSMYFPTAMQAPFTPQPLGLAGTSFVPAGYGGILPAAGGPITVMGHPQQNIYLGHQAMQQMQPTGMPFGQFSVLPGFGGGSAAQIPGVGMMTFRQPQSMTVMQQQQAGSTIGGDNSFLLPPATVDYFNANLAMGSYKAGMAGAGAGPLGQQNSSAAMVPMNTSSGGGLWSNNLGGQMMYNNPAGGGQSGLQMMKQPGGMPSSTQQPMAPPSNNNSYDPNNSRHANANNKAKIKREHSEDAEGDDDEEFDSNEEDEQEDISDGTDEYRPRKSRSKRSRISGGSSSRRRQRITGTTLASAQQARALPLPPSPTTTAPYDDYMASLRVPHLDRAEREAMGDKPKPFRCNVCGLRFGSSGVGFDHHSSIPARRSRPLTSQILFLFNSTYRAMATFTNHNTSNPTLARSPGATVGSRVLTTCGFIIALT